MLAGLNKTPKTPKIPYAPIPVASSFRVGFGYLNTFSRHRPGNGHRTAGRARAGHKQLKVSMVGVNLLPLECHCEQIQGLAILLALFKMVPLGLKCGICGLPTCCSWHWGHPPNRAWLQLRERRCADRCLQPPILFKDRLRPSILHLGLIRRGTSVQYEKLFPEVLEQRKVAALQPRFRVAQAETLPFFSDNLAVQLEELPTAVDHKDHTVCFAMSSKKS